LFIVWLLALYSYDRLNQYCKTIKRSKEADAFKNISRGLGWLAWGLPLNGILNTILALVVSSHLHFETASLIIHNYSTLLVAFFALHFISTGTHRLSFNMSQSSPLAAARAFIYIFALFAVTYTYFVIENFKPHNLAALNPYRLPHWVVLTTYVAPYLYIWFVGLWSVMELALYEKTTKGVIYKQYLRYLSAGFGVVILSSIAIQYIDSVSPKLHSLTLDNILIFIYSLLATYALGVTLIALGSQKLKKIEEV
jgi:hypothetical protein